MIFSFSTTNWVSLIHRQTLRYSFSHHRRTRRKRAHSTQVEKRSCWAAAGMKWVSPPCLPMSWWTWTYSKCVLLASKKYWTMKDVEKLNVLAKWRNKLQGNPNTGSHDEDYRVETTELIRAKENKGRQRETAGADSSRPLDTVWTGQVQTQPFHTCRSQWEIFRVRRVLTC